MESARKSEVMGLLSLLQDAMNGKIKPDLQGLRLRRWQKQRLSRQERRRRQREYHDRMGTRLTREQRIQREVDRIMIQDLARSAARRQDMEFIHGTGDAKYTYSGFIGET
jgi:hypothetical protein